MTQLPMRYDTEHDTTNQPAFSLMKLTETNAP